MAIIGLFSHVGAQAEILKSKTINGKHWVSVNNSEYDHFSFRTAEFYQVGALDMKLGNKAGNKNIEEIKSICTNFKMEDSKKPVCYSEEVYGSKSVAKRVCAVETTFSCL